MTTPLLAIVELGGYPDFSALYRRLGYEPETVTSGRRALSTARKLCPAVIVTEFNFQRDFRDRTSSLESLLALTQSMPETRVIAFYETFDAEPLARLRARFSNFIAIERPIDEAKLQAALGTADRVTTEDTAD